MTIIRSTEMQQKENSKLMEDFSHAFVSNDLNAIQELFHKDGIFLGRCTKAKALGYFHKLFFGEEGIVDYQHAYFNKGIALGISCGAEVLEIRCDKKLHFRKNGLPYFAAFGEMQDIFSDERVFRFTFEFTDGQISAIKIPTKYIEKVGQLVMEN
jgi:hypothetical protein